METAITVLNELPFTKVEQQTFAQKVINEVLEGNIDPIALDIRLKAMEEVLKAVRADKRVKDLTIEEASKYGKSFVLHGATVTVSSRTTKDYTGLDTVLDDLYAQAEKLKESIKAREMTVSSGVDPVTGETFNPPKTSTSNFLQYKF